MGVSRLVVDSAVPNLIEFAGAAETSFPPLSLREDLDYEEQFTRGLGPCDLGVWLEATGQPGRVG